jgi:2-desacetyl-2-hydroxyethyl bacteriochlorophyllide A dehydrogenase
MGRSAKGDRVQAVTYAGPGEVRVDDVARPEVAAGSDVIVRVNVTAICGSDLHLLDGKTPGMRVGGVIGHEYVGEVVDAGDDSADLVGARVLGSFLIACGECSACAGGRFNFCHHRRALGLGTLTGDLDGAQAEYVRVPDAHVNVKTLPESLPDDAALFAGDILATGFHATAVGEVAPGDVVVVIGAGPVGLMCALAIRAVGARPVVMDTDPTRVAFARERFDLEAHDVSEIDAGAAIAGATEGVKADIAMDAVGAVSAVKSAMRCVRDGGRIVIVGVYGAERYELPMGVAWIRGLDIRFTGMASVQARWDAALAAIADGSIDATPAITHRLALADAQKGYELFKTRVATKVILEPR